MAPDFVAPPIGLSSVTARVNGTQLLLEGRYQAGASTPLLVWPRTDGQTWLNPCLKATDLCCLRQLSVAYRNDALSSVMPSGTACLRSLPPNLVGGSRPGVRSFPDGSFSASVPLSTAFVAILFVHASPFFMLDGFQAFSADANVEANLVIPHNPCYSVVVPGTLVSVCMQCNNALPPNARYVWTASWYLDYQCEWQCAQDFVRNGPECVLASRQVPLVGLIAGASASVIVAITAIYCALRRVQVMAAAPEAPAIDVVRVHSEMIQFKDVDKLQLKMPSLRAKKN
jgi:hypothetical protein